MPTLSCRCPAGKVLCHIAELPPNFLDWQPGRKERSREMYAFMCTHAQCAHLQNEYAQEGGASAVRMHKQATCIHGSAGGSTGAHVHAQMGC